MAKASVTIKIAKTKPRRRNKPLGLRHRKKLGPKDR